MIFADADAFIGVSVPTDVLHKRSLEIFNGLLSSDELLVTSWDVVDEVATKLARFTTKRTAVQFLKFLKFSNIRIEFVGQNLVPDIIRLFNKQRSKRVSLTDCTNMVMAKSLGVTTFFSFDEHYLKNGFKLLTSVT